MTNKLIEFLHDPEAKGLILGNNGFRAERYPVGGVRVWYEGMELCWLEPDGLQWSVRITSPDSRAKCNRMTEILALLGMPPLRVRWTTRKAYIQRMYNGLVMAEYGLPLKQPLKVTI